MIYGFPPSCKWSLKYDRVDGLQKVVFGLVKIHSRLVGALGISIAPWNFE